MNTARYDSFTADALKEGESHFNLNKPCRIWRRQIDNGEKVRLHYNNILECIFFENVIGDAIIEQKHLKIKPKQIMVISPGLIHGFEMKRSPGGTVIVFQVSLKEINNYLRIESFFPSTKNLLFPVVSDTYDSLATILTRLQDKQLKSIYEMSIAVLSILDVISKSSQEMIEVNELLPNRIRESIIWTIEHFKESITLTDAAKISFYTEEHFSRIFKKYTRSTWSEFLRKVRLDRAKVLLINGSDVTSACYESGFGNLSHFIQVFRKYERCTPRQFKLSFKS